MVLSYSVCKVALKNKETEGGTQLFFPPAALLREYGSYSGKFREDFGGGILSHYLILSSLEYIDQ